MQGEARPRKFYPQKIFFAESGKTAKYLTFENFRLYGINISLRSAYIAQHNYFLAIRVIMQFMAIIVCNPRAKNYLYEKN